MSTHGAPAELPANNLASWLVCNGFPDRNTAELASRSLEVPCLKPLWSLLQLKMRNKADRTRLPANKGTKTDTVRDPCDPKLLQEEKLTRLTDQVQGVMQQLTRTQVCIV